MAISLPTRQKKGNNNNNNKRSSNYSGRYIRLPLSTFSLMLATLRTRDYITGNSVLRKRGDWAPGMRGQEWVWHKTIRGSSSLPAFALRVQQAPGGPRGSEATIPGGGKLSFQIPSPRARLKVCVCSYKLPFQMNFPMEKTEPRCLKSVYYYHELRYWLH